MSVSACMIVWNEEQMLPYALKFLTSLEQVTEICIIVDEDSTDQTLSIVKSYNGKNLVFGIRKLDNFANQKNAALELASRDWILLMDADETYSQNIDNLLKDLHSMPGIHAVRLPTLLTFPDRKHCMKKPDPDPHIRIWKRKFAKYVGTVHETLVDIFDRNLHTCTNMDILNERSVYLKHHQFLKSDPLLKSKGDRWERFFTDSARVGAPLDKDFWIRGKKLEPELYGIAELPKVLWDVTTEDL